MRGAAPPGPAGASATAVASATLPALIIAISGTFLRPWARRDQSIPDRFEAIGAAVIAAITAGCTAQTLSATTATKPPAITAKLRLVVSVHVRSCR